MLKVIERATTWPVSEAEAMSQCRLDASADADQLDQLDRLVKAATATVGAAAGLTLQPTTYEERLDCWPTRHLSLSTGPVREVEAVTYLDENGDEQTVSEDDWFWIDTPEGADVYFQRTFGRPRLQDDRPQAVRVRFVAGFDDPNASEGESNPDLELPEQARQAVLLLVGDWFANRESAVVGEVSNEIRMAAAFDRLIGQIRVYR